MTVSPLLTCAAPAARTAVRETSAGKRPRVEQAQRAREKGKCQLHMLIHAHSTHTLTRTLILPHARTRSHARSIAPSWALSPSRGRKVASVVAGGASWRARALWRLCHWPRCPRQRLMAWEEPVATVDFADERGLRGGLDHRRVLVGARLERGRARGRRLRTPLRLFELVRGIDNLARELKDLPTTSV